MGLSPSRTSSDPGEKKKREPTEERRRDQRRWYSAGALTQLSRRSSILGKKKKQDVRQFLKPGPFSQKEREEGWTEKKGEKGEPKPSLQKRVGKKSSAADMINSHREGKERTNVRKCEAPSWSSCKGEGNLLRENGEWSKRGGRRECKGRADSLKKGTYIWKDGAISLSSSTEACIDGGYKSLPRHEQKPRSPQIVRGEKREKDVAR